MVRSALMHVFFAVLFERRKYKVYSLVISLNISKEAISSGKQILLHISHRAHHIATEFGCQYDNNLKPL